LGLIYWLTCNLGVFSSQGFKFDYFLCQFWWTTSYGVLLWLRTGLRTWAVGSVPST